MNIYPTEEELQKIKEWKDCYYGEPVVKNIKKITGKSIDEVIG